MSNFKLFRQTGQNLSELQGMSAPLEKSLQNLFEQNLETLLGVRCLASEYTTSRSDRIDTLGLDENNYPVIIEYKRNFNQNIINQGLFYMDWLMDHRANFSELVRNKFDEKAVKTVE